LCMNDVWHKSSLSNANYVMNCDNLDVVI
jgi:hypothetical protein